MSIDLNVLRMMKKCVSHFLSIGKAEFLNEKTPFVT